MLDPGIALRPVRDGDEPFLRSLYASTRADELAQVPWTDAQKRAFADMQFDAQHHHYREVFPNAEFSIVERDGQPIGRLYVDRRAKEIRIVDIALIPETRNLGIGGRLLGTVLEEGRRTGKPVTIHVEKFNPAARLYERLGFREIEDRGVHRLMEWSPGSVS